MLFRSGLISSLCVFAKINELGFIETPYRKVENGKVDLSDNGLIYLTAEEEEEKVIAQGNAPLNDDGTFVLNRVKSRQDADFPVVEPSEVDLMDVAPQQIASIAASLIPFLEHDDANRALMGIADTQKNRLVFCPGFFKSFGTPWIPAHWIVSVLEQIG